MALERVLGAARSGHRVQARRLSTGADRAFAFSAAACGAACGTQRRLARAWARGALSAHRDVGARPGGADRTRVHRGRGGRSAHGAGKRLRYGGEYDRACAGRARVTRVSQVTSRGGALNARSGLVRAAYANTRRDLGRSAFAAPRIRAPSAGASKENQFETNCSCRSVRCGRK
ncbi:hypothetical protein PT2222_280079 [Paraburkholderia tropica]